LIPDAKLWNSAARVASLEEGLDIRGLSIVFRCRTESANAIAQDHCQAWEAYGPSIRFQSTEVVFLLTLITSRAAFYSRNLRNWRNARGTGVRPCPGCLVSINGDGYRGGMAE
jgi:hypothetical protein